MFLFFASKVFYQKIEWLFEDDTVLIGSIETSSQRKGGWLLTGYGRLSGCHFV